jgi:hypothetical protein
MKFTIDILHGSAVQPKGRRNLHFETIDPALINSGIHRITMAMNCASALYFRRMA